MSAIVLPLGGNSFVTRGSAIVTPGGWRKWRDAGDVFEAYVKCSAGILDLSLSVRPRRKGCVIACSVSDYGAPDANERLVTIPAATGIVPLGGFETGGGYVKIKLRGVSKSGASFPDCFSLLLSGSAAENARGYVKDGDTENYYWTRRGPSIHLSYPLPTETDCEWFYNELTVPSGLSPVGTYAMAIGFDCGYFGIQVNSPSERRILFSVWSPYSTDDPSEIPDELRVRLLGKGDGVVSNDFGGEGSGGQSYLRYQWQSGVPYRFALRSRPSGSDSGEYSAYFFFPERGEWGLIASFLRPRSSGSLLRLHSFLENFDDSNGYLRREALFRNQWARTRSGAFLPLSTARVTFDATAQAGNRLDCMAGTRGDSFFLSNGGFFNDTASPSAPLTCPQPTVQPILP